MSETTSKANDDSKHLLTNSNRRNYVRLSGKILHQLKKTPQLQNMKSLSGIPYQAQPITHKNFSRNLISPKNLIPHLTDSIFRTSTQQRDKRKPSIQFPTPSKSRNDLNQIYQTITTLSPHLTTTISPNKNNEINFKDRRLIRQGTTRMKSVPSRDLDEIETFNQLTQFKTNDLGTMTSSNKETYRPSTTRNLLALTESDIIYTDRTIKDKNKSELKRLIKINPYQSLKNNFKYTFNLNQMAFEKASKKTHRLLNYIHSIDRKVIYKVNQCSTIFIKQEMAKGNLIKRLIERKSDLPPELKSVIFWQGVKWLWTNYSLQIKQLLFSFMNFKWFLDRELLFSKNAINELFSLIQISKGNDFSEALFLVFNENHQPKVNMKIAINVLIATKEASYKEKITETMNLWASKCDDSVKLWEIVEMAQLIFSDKRDEKKVIEMVKKSLQVTDLTTAIVNKTTLCRLCIKDYQIKYLIKRNKINLSNYEQVFENEIINMYNINIRNSKGFIESNDAQKKCDRELMRYQNILSIITECKDKRLERKQRKHNEKEEY